MLVSGLVQIWLGAGLGSVLSVPATAPIAGGASTVVPTRVAAAYEALPFLNLRDNVMEFSNRASLSAFHRKWASPRANRIVIAHFGDSLIQNGGMPAAARARLQEVKGDGGRGMIFPYAVAPRSYDHNDYRSTSTGVWETANSMRQPPRLPLGVSGFVARTSDATASFAFEFRKPLGPGPKRIRILYRSPGADYRLTVATAGLSRTAELPADPASAATRVLDLRFDGVGDTIRFDLARTPFAGGTFELHGISIENTGPGLIYHNLGVGGAVFAAVNDQILFREQIGALAPDLVVLDYGTNNILYTDSIPAGHEAVVLRTIAKVRSAYPDAAIVITSAQDLNYKGHNIAATRAYSDLMRRIALENGCMFYDWYRVAGGQGAMARWFASGLASRDNIHLNGRGYAVKGDLFAQALLNTLTIFADSRNSSLILPRARASTLSPLRPTSASAKR